MQVTLDPVDWTKLTRFPSAQEYFDWAYESDGDALPEGYDLDDSGWTSDSAMQYFDVAEALEHVQGVVDAPAAENLARGILRVLCVNGHVDDFGTGPATDNHHWISASPETTREIWEHARLTDWREVSDVLRRNPPKFGDVHNAIDTVFMPVVEQHLRVLELAASRGWGLMGHCG